MYLGIYIYKEFFHIKEKKMSIFRLYFIYIYIFIKLLKILIIYIQVTNFKSVLHVSRYTKCLNLIFINTATKN